MTLINIRNKLKKENNDYVIFMKFGNFYRVFDNDTYIIWFYTYYKINNHRLGFPITELNKIKDRLLNENISIIIYDNNDYSKIECINNMYNEILIISKDEYLKYKLLDILKDYDCIEDIKLISDKYEINYNN